MTDAMAGCVWGKGSPTAHGLGPRCSLWSWEASPQGGGAGRTGVMGRSGVPGPGPVVGPGSLSGLMGGVRGVQPPEGTGKRGLWCC